jgi:hypothetical protein
MAHPVWQDMPQTGNGNETGMNDDDTLYVELAVHFGRDTALTTFPYLGQTTFLGNMEALLSGGSAKPPRMFIPVCASPAVRDYMGQALEDGHLAEVASKRIPIDVEGVEFDTMDGLWMCGRIQQALSTPKATKAGVSAIIVELGRETESLITLLAAAGERHLRFHFNLQKCEHPPVALKDWVTADLAETGRWLGKIMDEIEKEKGSI